MRQAPACDVFSQVIDALGKIPYWLIALLARLGIGAIFLRSGMTKVDGFTVTDSTIYLFSDEYQVPLLSPVVAAHLAAYAEHLFPLLLFLGLATRLSALALFGMTLVIQLFVYPGLWPDHTLWAAVLLLLVSRGPGGVSVDYWIVRRFG